MVLLILVGFAAGMIAGISPCILPVLPVVLVAGGVPVEGEQEAPSIRRPLAVVAGLVVSFSLLVIAGATVLSSLGLPSDLLRNLGIALLVVLGAGLLVPSLGHLLERPFRRLAGRPPSAAGGGFTVGLALGLVFVPCAGPILAAITVLGSTHRVGFEAALVTVAFALGAAVPLFFIALGGNRLAARLSVVKRRAAVARQVGGALLLVVALGLAFNAFDGLQRAVPGYTSALQSKVEGSSTVRTQLGSLTGTSSASLAHCPAGTPGLVSCGPAPRFTGITAWLHTPGDTALTLSSLRGRVVLVDFWTYTCINCERTLPHLEAWDARYRAAGLTIVGVHTPEFSFEHDVGNVATASAQLGVRYPVAIDDNAATWGAYANEYWPAEYLIDDTGHVRHVDFGEGGYATTEALIRTLLHAANPTKALPPPTSVATAVLGQTNPETYLGYDRAQYLDAASNPPPDRPAALALPSSVPLGAFALGGTWTQHAEGLTAGDGATLELGYEAADVYLVLSGTGTVEVSTDAGRPPKTLAVSGVPRLYTLVSGSSSSTGTLTLHVSPGVELYDFTFG